MDGDLVNALTRSEWNAAYFLGLEKILKGETNGDLAAQVRAGVSELREAGYAFEQLEPGPGGHLCAAVAPRPCEHDRACREIFSGTFDHIGRAREATAWLKATLRQDRTGWLRGLLTVYDRVHGRGVGSTFRGDRPGLAVAPAS